MSRDHYSGVPKRRPVLLDRNNQLDVDGVVHTVGRRADFFGNTVSGTNGEKNVKDYGALGDGSTDDSAAIALADSAARAAGSTTWFPPGVYRLASTVTLGTGSNWRAFPGTAVIKHKGTTLHGFLTATGKTGLRLEGFKFDGDIANVSSYASGRWVRSNAIAFAGCTDITLKNCEITGMRGPAINHRDCTRFKLLDCYIHDCDSWAIVGSEAVDCEYRDNYVEDTYTLGLYVDGAVGDGSVRVRMIGNTVINCQNDPLLDASGIGISVNVTAGIVVADVEIIGNYSLNNGSMGFSLTPAQVDDVGKMIVQGNHSEGHNSNSGIGFELIGQHISMTGNVVKNNKFGITIQQARGVEICNNDIINTLDSSTQAGIAITPDTTQSPDDAGVSNCIISGNNIYGGHYGFQIGANEPVHPSRSIIFSNNIVTGAQHGIITQSASVEGFKIVNNYFDSDIVGLTDGRGLTLHGGTDVDISGNTFRINTAWVTADNITINGATAGLTIRNNTFIGGRYGLNFSSGSSTNVVVGGNISRGTTTDRNGFNNIVSYIDEGTNSWNQVSAAPSSGYWHTGTRAFNTIPTTSGTIGWVCTVSGTPGTWKTWGNIS